jgi:hypothetical protein
MRWPRAATVAGVVAVAALAALAALVAARRQIAREAVAGWLASKGVSSDSRFAVIGPGRLVGSLRIGPPTAPDATVERAEVRYSLTALLTGHGVQVTDVTLTRPVLRASWRGGRFSAGALDPLIAEFLKQPPKPGEPHPRVVVDDGRLTLATDFGVLDARVSARVADAKLVALDALTAPGRFAAPQAAAEVGPTALSARAKDGRLALALRAPFQRLTSPQGELGAGQLTLSVEGAYPDLARRAPIPATASAVVTAAAVRAPGLTAGPLRLTARATRLLWRRTQGAVDGDAVLSGDLQDLDAGALRLGAAAADGRGAFSLGPKPAARLELRAQGHGGWRGLGAPAAGDTAQVAAVKRALLASRASVEGVALTVAADRIDARLTGPVRLFPDRGGELRVAPRGGGYGITVAGGGLPSVEADVRRVSFSPGGFAAEGAVRAAGAFGPASGARVEVAGRLEVANGRTTFAASRCVGFRANRIDLGSANAAEGLSGGVCADGGPLVTVRAAGWRLAGRAQDVALALPSQTVAFEGGSGRFRFEGARGGLGGEADFAAAHVRDTAADARFQPFTASGHVDLGRERLTGELEARFGGSGPTLRAGLRHDLATGAGEAQLDSGELRFGPGVLQPTDLSPLAAPLGTAVAGSARFTGVVRWTKGGVDGGEGLLATPGLDFKSPAGQVSGLAGEIRFTSLAPLVAPPGQVVRLRRVEAAIPLTEAVVTFGLDETALRVTGGEAQVGGGRVEVERLELPLAEGPPITGAARVEGVQLRDLVKASPFADKVALDAKVSGRIPFTAQGGKVTIVGGDLHAITPGRLSISREALNPPPAPGAPPPPTDTISEFAYQALENLAFDKLDAGLDTHPDGRLGVLFHIVGRHDPPQRQEIAISWTDLIRRRFLGRTLPLPSDARVDLTLDTTLDLDDLLKDYGEFERLRSRSSSAQRAEQKEDPMRRETAP